jgi:hypothetical protein
MCEVMADLNGEPRKGYLTGVTNGGSEAEIQFFEEDGVNVFEHPEFNLIEQVKPILRPLSSMTEDEFKERFYDPASAIFCGSFEMQYKTFIGLKIEQVCYPPDYIAWLLSKHFDLFNLIPNGEAITTPADYEAQSNQKNNQPIGV